MSKPQAAVIVAGGDPIIEGTIPPLPEPRFVIAADSGLHAAQDLGLAVDLIVGDLDSASPDAVETALAAGAGLEQHPTDKDATDLELALEAALLRDLAPTYVLGGAGFDRVDHFVANALVLTNPRFAPLEAQWWVKGAHLVAVHDRAAFHGEAGDVVTMLAVGGPAAGITTSGLRWALDRETLESGSTRGVSNQMTGRRATVTLTSGSLLVIHQEGPQ